MVRILKNIFGWIWHNIKRNWQVYNQAARGKLVDVIEWETMELENIFGLLVLGSFVGLPSPPMHITLDLMPYMEKELLIMLERVDTASAALSELVSLLDVG